MGNPQCRLQAGSMFLRPQIHFLQHQLRAENAVASQAGKLFCAFLELTLTTRQVLRIQKGLMRVSPCLLRLS